MNATSKVEYPQFISWMRQPIAPATLESYFFYYVIGYPVSTAHNIDSDNRITLTVTGASIAMGIVKF
jgi:hypothetical protein